MSGNKLVSILDKEIQSKNEDLFGHIHYAEILSELIKNNVSPFTIGLLGKWGAGKTSIKKLCKEEYLPEDEFKIIDFNAWRYESQDVRLSLLQSIYFELGGSEQTFDLVMFAEKTLKKPKPLNFKETWDNFLQNFSVNILQICLVPLIPLIITALFAIPLLIALFFDKINGWQLFSVITPLYIASLKISENLIKKPIGNQNFIFPSYMNEEIKKLPSLNNYVQQEKIITKQLEKFIEDNPNKRIIVFVDDLDRLPTNEMLAGIDAIRVFLDIQLLDKKDKKLNNKIIFVISCDENNISNAIEKEKRSLKLDAENRKQYIDRIFQFRIEIPSIDTEDLKEIAEKAIKPLIDNNEAIIKKEETHANIIGKLIHLDVKNPRTAKQLINSFLQSYWIAQKREQKCDNCNKDKNKDCLTKPCLLTRGKITTNLETLAIITVLKVNFPYFYNSFIQEPDLLKYLLYKSLNSTINSKYLVENKQEIIDLAEQFFIPLEKGQKRLSFEISKEYSKFYYYLSSIRNFKLPDDLSSFILLFDDKISREIGLDLARPLYNILASNSDKLLSQLKLNSAGLIDEAYTEALYKTYKEVYRSGTHLSCENADLAVISIFDKLSGDYKKKLAMELFSSLSNKLDNNLSFVNTIGIQSLGKLLLANCLEENQMSVLYYYLIAFYDRYTLTIEDLKCLIEIGLDLIYKFNKCTNLKESIIKLIHLGEYNTEGFIDRADERKEKDPASEEILIIKAEDEIAVDAQYIPIKMTMTWVSNYNDPQNTFLFDLGNIYITEVLNKNNSDYLELKNTNLEEIKSNLRLIYDKYILSKDKAKYIESLCNCIKHANSNISSFAYNYLIEKDLIKSIDIKYVEQIVEALSERLVYQEDNKDENESCILQNTDEILKFLSKLFSQYVKDFNYDYKDDLMSNLANLSIAYTKISEYKHFIIEIFEDLFRYAQKEACEVLEYWVDNLFQKTFILGEKIIALLSSKYIENYSTEEFSYLSKLKEALKTNFPMSIQIIESTVIDEYRILVENLSENAIQNELILDHISEVYNTLSWGFTNGVRSFDQLFPIIAPLMKHRKTERLNALLVKLNSQLITATPTQKTYNIHKWMNGNWFTTGTKLTDYKPDKIFETNYTLINDKNNSKDQRLILLETSKFLYDKVIIEHNIENNKKMLFLSLQMSAWYGLNLGAKYLFDNIELWVNTYTSSCIRHCDKEQRNKLWEKYIKLALTKNKEMLKKSTKELIKAHYNSNDWISLLYKNNKKCEILKESIFELIKEDNSFLLKDNRTQITNLLINSLGTDYKTVAIIISRHLLHKQQYQDESFKGSQHRIISWVEEMLHPIKGYGILKIINAKYINELTLSEAKKISDKYKKLKSEYEKMKKRK